MKQNKQAYTLLVVSMIIGFIILLTTGVYNLVLSEMKDNRALGEYFKTYAGAEAAQELALSDIKEIGFGYVFNAENIQMLVGDDAKFDPTLSYSHNGKTKEYNGVLTPRKHDVIPLFYIDEKKQEKKIFAYNLQIFSPNDISWSIVSQSGGLVGTGGDIKKGKYKQFSITQTSTDFITRDKRVKEFLGDNSKNYLILFNSSTDVDISYSISSTEFFTKPKIQIITSGEMNNQKQNIQTTIDFEKIVDKAKFALFSS